MKKYIEFTRAYLSNESPDPAIYGVYPQNVRPMGSGVVLMADAGDEDVLVSFGCDSGFSDGSIDDGCVTALLTHENANALRRLLPYTAPSRVLSRNATFGAGDRLGITGDGFLRVFNACDVTPVLAQQSTRELSLTNRTYADVVDAATFSVFRSGYMNGWGADGDHLKSADEIQNALDAGCTMITLDCSEHIRKPSQAADASVRSGNESWRMLRARYPEELKLGAETLHLSDQTLYDAFSIYEDSIVFISSIYEEFFAGTDGKADFEISIDETETPTTPKQHYFVASELRRRDVQLQTLAPRFIGEFPKGVDYRGDIGTFEQQLIVHCEIARQFGYKISVHSGSDKFSVFPLIGKYTEGRFHLKTAGTNWLEAMRIVAEKQPALYREAHALAFASFESASKYYHVSTNLSNIPPLQTLSDEELPSLFDQDDLRQLIHITYVFLLADATLKKRLYAFWRNEREAYAQAIERHIGRHVELVTGRKLSH